MLFKFNDNFFMSNHIFTDFCLVFTCKSCCKFNWYEHLCNSGAFDYSLNNSPIRLVRVMDPPMVPHPDVRGTGVVAYVTLVHLLLGTFYDTGQTTTV